MTNSRDKGGRGEREAVALWRALGYNTARRGPQFVDGSDNADVIGVPYWVEVKRYERVYPSTYAAGFRQGQKNMTRACEKEYIPDMKDVIVMARGNSGKWMVCAPVQLMIDLGYPLEIVEFKHKYIEARYQVMIVTWEQFSCLQRRFDGERESGTDRAVETKKRG